MFVVTFASLCPVCLQLPDVMLTQAGFVILGSFDTGLKAQVLLARVERYLDLITVGNALLSIFLFQLDRDLAIPGSL